MLSGAPATPGECPVVVSVGGLLVVGVLAVLGTVAVRSIFTSSLRWAEESREPVVDGHGILSGPDAPAACCKTPQPFPRHEVAP